MKLFSRITCGFAVTLFLLWCIGALLSDRWTWSQWLAWIPTFFVILFFALAGTLCFVDKKKALGSLFFGGTISLLVYFCCVEHQLHKSNEQEGAIKIVGWTMSHPKGMVAAESAECIVQLNGDITLLTHGWKVRGEQVLRDWLGTTGRKVINSQFTLLTKFAPLQVQTLIASNGIYISSFTLDTSAELNKNLVLWAVDFPSSLVLPKMEIAHRMRRLLQTIEAPPPDIVLGDFNMTRNSVAIETMFPTLKDAVTDSGIGVLASYPMKFPLFHIDHILINDTIRPTYYELFNPHIGRHRIQVMEFENGSTPEPPEPQKNTRLLTK